MAKNPLLGNLLTGSLVKNVPLPAAVTDSTHAPLTLYFDNNSMEDLWIAITWGKSGSHAFPQALRSKESVISELKQLIGWTLAEPSRNGYFASLYLRVTSTIRSKVGRAISMMTLRISHPGGLPFALDAEKWINGTLRTAIPDRSIPAKPRRI